MNTFEGGGCLLVVPDGVEQNSARAKTVGPVLKYNRDRVKILRADKRLSGTVLADEMLLI